MLRVTSDPGLLLPNDFGHRVQLNAHLPALISQDSDRSCPTTDTVTSFSCLEVWLGCSSLLHGPPIPVTSSLGSSALGVRKALFHSYPLGPCHSQTWLVGVAGRSSATTRPLFLSSPGADFGVEQAHVSCGEPAGSPGECGPATLSPGNNTLGYVRSAHNLPLREVKVHTLGKCLRDLAWLVHSAPRMDK